MSPPLTTPTILETKPGSTLSWVYPSGADIVLQTFDSRQARWMIESRTRAVVW